MFRQMAEGTGWAHQRVIGARCPEPEPGWEYVLRIGVRWDAARSTQHAARRIRLGGPAQCVQAGCTPYCRTRYAMSPASCNDITDTVSLPPPPISISTAPASPAAAPGRHRDHDLSPAPKSGSDAVEFDASDAQEHAAVDVAADAPNSADLTDS
ncbi:uncharacterized protein N7482_002827 [Penicillium canariense]|uniref:Uncharacterized protein n=1 Tax=Penicillium canariense TaxID=189055 RepID=A0A9W9IJM2_9EURO|nr:uncharacterized protein N7482_002827 [Penicillium canariense]KAJ5176950.1 hypothetical protein N7482_002827 [Penicillium canariense]